MDSLRIVEPQLWVASVSAAESTDRVQSQLELAGLEQAIREGGAAASRGVAGKRAERLKRRLGGLPPTRRAEHWASRLADSTIVYPTTSALAAALVANRPATGPGQRLVDKVVEIAKSLGPQTVLAAGSWRVFRSYPAVTQSEVEAELLANGLGEAHLADVAGPIVRFLRSPAGRVVGIGGAAMGAAGAVYVLLEDPDPEEPAGLWRGLLYGLRWVFPGAVVGALVAGIYVLLRRRGFAS
ncbi:MAG TPA: hypothetical protein VL332_01940 [Candidatus Saccharimonadaceae bacterium]|jgi:hypothetical protein|nr:hypothetical protein [Candidatus Saccharimonadaceae bacterium]